jgi:hypothetical protein
MIFTLKRLLHHRSNSFQRIIRRLKFIQLFKPAVGSALCNTFRNQQLNDGGA